ncbi:MAG TPA: transketolase C-terminal domain-containing protein, partial [Rhodanobacteraceae bacterium]|nr:transketolase C-terminal domain-containing protein [Rhodanobacteraceae bacterium]
DAVESAIAWKAAIERSKAPSCLVFSRQNLAHQHRTDEQVNAIARGGYVLADPGSAKFDAILIATGSEVDLAIQAMRALAADGIAVRVVSMPCTNVFDTQPLEYRESVLPSWCRKRVAVEAGVTDFWRKYVGLDGAVVGIDTFGASAPAEALFKYFGFSVEHVVAAVKALA